MGTMLLAAGLLPGTAPDSWNLENPDAVRAVHRAYREAGSMLTVTNTFGCNAPRLKRSGYRAADLARAGVRLAKEAGEGLSPAPVAMDIGPLGVFLEPLGDLSFEDAVELFREPVEAGAEEGADCLYIETMSDLAEASAAIAACRKYGKGLPVFCTMSFTERGRLMTGAKPEQVAKTLTEAGADAIGCNCGVGPEQLLAILPILRENTDLPLIACPNAGMPEFEDGDVLYPIGPEAFSGPMGQLLSAGAWMIGGCCGTTPEYIRVLREKLF